MKGYSLVMTQCIYTSVDLVTLNCSGSVLVQIQYTYSLYLVQVIYSFNAEINLRPVLVPFLSSSGPQQAHFESSFRTFLVQFYPNFSLVLVQSQSSFSPVLVHF